MPRPTERIMRSFGWVIVLGLCLAIAAWWQMLRAFPHTQEWDAPFFHKMLEVARISVTRYHELPLWNPFECGGVPLWDNPQGIGAAPVSLLTLLIGSTRTIEVWHIVHSTLGFVCMWLLTRSELRLSKGASFVAAGMWTYAGVHNQHLTGGHLVWVSYMYFPLAVVLWRRAERDLRAAAGLGLLGALCMLEGGTYPLPYLAILLGAETLFRLWPVRRFRPIATAALVVIVVAFAVAAMRFIPVLDQLFHHKRTIDPDTDAMKWENLRAIFLARDHGRDARGQQYDWPEYGAYVGPVLLGLAVAGLLALRRSELWMLVIFVFSFALMCGHFSKWAPWSMLNAHVYPFKEMRVPSRFVVLVTLFLSVFAGIAIDRWPRRLRFLRGWKERALTLWLVALGSYGVWNEIAVGSALVKDSFTGAPQSFKAVPSVHLFYVDGSPPFLDAPHTNKADLGCWEEWAFERDAPLWLKDVPQAKGVGAGVKVLLSDRTPNTFTVDMDVKAPGRLLLNSTYDRGWRTDVGTVARAKKMLAVDVPAGVFTVHVTYWPYGLTTGLIVSGVSCLLIVLLALRAFLRRRRARRSHRGLAGMVPIKNPG